MVSLQKEVLDGVELDAVLHAVLQVNSNSETLADGGVMEDVDLEIGIITKTKASARITKPSIIMTIAETGRPCPLIRLTRFYQLNK